MSPITKDQLLNYLNNHFAHSSKPMSCTLELLRHPFGFKRVDGVEFMLTKLLKPSITEEIMSYQTDAEIIRRAQEWGKENGFVCYFDDRLRSFLFEAISPSTI